MFSGGAPIGQQAWTSGLNQSFIVPPGVYSIAAVCIGAGGGGARGTSGDSVDAPAGGGGALSYSNAIPVTPGETLSLYIPYGGVRAVSNMSNGSAGGDAAISRSGTALLRAKGGEGGNWGTTLGGAGGSSAAGVGDVKWSGGNGRDQASSTFGGGSGLYTANGGNGGGGAVQCATLYGANTGSAIGRGGFGGAGNSQDGSGGGIRIMWGGGRYFPGNAADIL